MFPPRCCASSVSYVDYVRRHGVVRSGGVALSVTVAALMRLLIVSQYFWPETFRRINEVARDLVSRGHHVTVLCGTPNYPAGRLFEGYGWFPPHPRGVVRSGRLCACRLCRAAGLALAAGCKLPVLRLMASLLGPIPLPRQNGCGAGFQMSPVIQGIAAVVMKRLRARPHAVLGTGPVAGERDCGWRHPQPLVALANRKWLVRGLYRASALVLIQSRAFSSHVAAHGVPPDRIRYFPNLAESSYVPLPARGCSPGAEHGAAWISSDVRGHIGTAQDLPTVLAAAELTRERPEIQWVIVGDGSMRAWVQAEIERRRLAAVHLLGRFPVEDMPRLFAGVDALLVTLRRDPVLSLTIPARCSRILRAPNRSLERLTVRARR